MKCLCLQLEQLFETNVRMSKEIQNTEAVILNAAKKIFKQKGLDGATVQDIATEAGTTKSMVNYYFRSKEKLFAGVFREEFKNFFTVIISCLTSDLPLKEKIEKIVDLDIDKLAAFPELPVFIINEVNRNPDIVFATVGTSQVTHLMETLTRQIAREARKGIIKKIKAEDLILNIQALTVFPILAKPIASKILNINEAQYFKKMQERKKQIVDMIWNYIKAE